MAAVAVLGVVLTPESVDKAAAKRAAEKSEGNGKATAPAPCRSRWRGRACSRRR